MLCTLLLFIALVIAALHTSKEQYRDARAALSHALRTRSTALYTAVFHPITQWWSLDSVQATGGVVLSALWTALSAPLSWGWTAVSGGAGLVGGAAQWVVSMCSTQALR